MHLFIDYSFYHYFNIFERLPRLPKKNYIMEGYNVYSILYFGH
jgi:hypothetical protein